LCGEADSFPQKQVLLEVEGGHASIAEIADKEGAEYIQSVFVWPLPAVF
jgi:hypothetical protein